MTNNCCSREQLLQKISEVSFAVYDIQLFLDTHPKCQEALDYYHKKIAERKKYMNEYAEMFGPLTSDDAMYSSENCWKWMTEPFPWEKGGCRQSMWNYEKRLQYPVNIKTPNAKLAQFIMSQYGGPNCKIDIFALKK